MRKPQIPPIASQPYVVFKLAYLVFHQASASNIFSRQAGVGFLFGMPGQPFPTPTSEPVSFCPVKGEIAVAFCPVDAKEEPSATTRDSATMQPTPSGTMQPSVSSMPEPTPCATMQPSGHPSVYEELVADWGEEMSPPWHNYGRAFSSDEAGDGPGGRQELGDWSPRFID